MSTRIDDDCRNRGQANLWCCDGYELKETSSGAVKYLYQFFYSVSSALIYYPGSLVRTISTLSGRFRASEETFQMLSSIEDITAIT